MCARCEEIRRELEHCRRSQLTVNDTLAISLLQLLIEDLQDEKSSLHPDEATPSY